MTLRQLLREPLVHFLGLGLALFALYALVAPSDVGDDRIVISAAAVAALEAQYQKLWGRPPTAQELNALIDARVADEIRTREGIAMGLDKDDAVINRRVRQKYDLMAEEEDSAEPTEADFQAYLKANPDKFREPPVLSFRQIMVPLTGGEAEIETRIRQTRKALDSGTIPETAASLLPATMSEVPLDLVARDFGSRFAQALGAAPLGVWAGPTASAYGLHFVKVEARTPDQLPPLAEIRAKVSREWENARRTKAREARLAELRTRYEVVIEGQSAK